MDRRRFVQIVCRGLVGLALAGVLAVQSGCVSALATAVYLIKGPNVDPEYPDLKDKRVAVVCRPLVELEFANSQVSEDLARVVGVMLRKNGKKIDVVPAQEVAAWTDENNWEEFVDVGKAMDADVVIGIELEEFGLYLDQTLYQGRATVHVEVQDVTTGEILFEKQMPRFLYPPNSGIGADRPEEEFRQMFVGLLAARIGRLFYAYDPRNDYAQDSTALNW